MTKPHTTDADAKEESALGMKDMIGEEMESRLKGMFKR